MAENSEVENTRIRALLGIAVMVIGAWLVLSNISFSEHKVKYSPPPKTLNLAYGVWPKHIKVYGVHPVVSGMYVTCLSQKCEELFHER